MQSVKSHMINKKAADYVAKGNDVIKETKRIFKYGAGNQYDDIVGSLGESRNRMDVSRICRNKRVPNEYIDGESESDREYLNNLRLRNRIAYRCAVYDTVKGGNCGEYAEVSYELMRDYCDDDEVYVSIGSDRGHTGDGTLPLDHGFGVFDLPGTYTDNDDTLIVDAWPTEGRTLRWVDHFANRQKKRKRADSERTLYRRRKTKGNRGYRTEMYTASDKMKLVSNNDNVHINGREIIVGTKFRDSTEAAGAIAYDKDIWKQSLASIDGNYHTYVGRTRRGAIRRNGGIGSMIGGFGSVIRWVGRNAAGYIGCTEI